MTTDVFAQVLPWVLALLLVTGLALPLAAWAVPDWPDRGASLAPAVGLAVLTLSGYWVGQVAFGPHALLVGLGCLVALAAFAVRAGVSLPTRSALAPAAVFAGAFLLLLLGMRAAQPGITPASGEQFLDYGLIHAVRRAPALPPEDIWFAGEPLRYYYGGPLLTGLLTWLSDTPPRYAYNLMGPTVFATFVTAAYGLAGALADARGTPHRLAGILGAGLAGFAGTLATPLRGLSSFLPRDVAAEYGHALYGAIREPYPQAVDAARFLDGGEFSYWLGRYVIPDVPSAFPFWTYVNGDLRPHMYAGPFLLLAVALDVAYYRTPAGARTRRRLLLFGALPAVAGLLGVVNTFDLPAAVGVCWLAVFFADADARSLLPAPLRSSVPGATPQSDGGVGTATRSASRVRRWAPVAHLLTECRRALMATAVAGLAALLAVAWAAPMLLWNAPPNRGVAVLGPTSNLGGLLLVFGGFLAAFALWLGPLALGEASRYRRLTLGLVILVGLVLSTLVGYPAVGLFVPLVLGGWWLVRTRRAESFAVVLVVAGAGLALVPEFVHAVVWPYDPGAPRWNTVYKITMQVWTLWGVAGGVALAAVLARARESLTNGLGGLRRSPAAVGAATLAVGLVVLLAAFPAFAVGSFADDATGADGDLALSLNATTEVAEKRPGEVAAARWVREETTGQPTVVSKPAGRDVYTWEGGANPLSTLSGVPTVAGWEQSAGYQGPERFFDRLPDVRRIYEGEPVVVRTFLRRHDVDYVHVGPAERAAYGERAFAAEFDGISVAYENPTVTIYAVNRTAL